VKKKKKKKVTFSISEELNDRMTKKVAELNGFGPRQSLNKSSYVSELLDLDTTGKGILQRFPKNTN
jgi:hypothetical protein